MMMATDRPSRSMMFAEPLTDPRAIPTAPNFHVKPLYTFPGAVKCTRSLDQVAPPTPGEAQDQSHVVYDVSKLSATTRRVEPRSCYGGRGAPTSLFGQKKMPVEETTAKQEEMEQDEWKVPPLNPIQTLGTYKDTFEWMEKRLKKESIKISITQLSKEFGKEKDLKPRHAYTNLYRVKKQIVLLDLPLTTKVLFLFHLAVPLPEWLKKQLQTIGRCEYDREGRIAKYDSKDGMVRLEGSHRQPRRKPMEKQEKKKGSKTTTTRRKNAGSDAKSLFGKKSLGQSVKKFRESPAIVPSASLATTSLAPPTTVNKIGIFGKTADGKNTIQMTIDMQIVDGEALNGSDKPAQVVPQIIVIGGKEFLLDGSFESKRGDAPQ